MVILPQIICILKNAIVYLHGFITTAKVIKFWNKENKRLIINIVNAISPRYITYLLTTEVGVHEQNR